MKKSSGCGSFAEVLNYLGNHGNIGGKKVQHTAQHCNLKVKCDGKHFKHFYMKHKKSLVNVREGSLLRPCYSPTVH